MSVSLLLSCRSGLPRASGALERDSWLVDVHGTFPRCKCSCEKTRLAHPLEPTEAHNHHPAPQPHLKPQAKPIAPMLNQVLNPTSQVLDSSKLQAQAPSAQTSAFKDPALKSSQACKPRPEAKLSGPIGQQPIAPVQPGAKLGKRQT